MARKKPRPSFNYSLAEKRTFQLSDVDAQERVDFHCSGRRLVANAENARTLLYAFVKEARKRFSRKPANDGWAARIGLKWKTQEGKWVVKGIFYHSYLSLEDAIEGVVQNPELENLVSGDPDDEENQRAIASKTKRIEFISFDKYITRIDKPGFKRRGGNPKNAARGKRGKKKNRVARRPKKGRQKKKSRSVRRRKH